MIQSMTGFGRGEAANEKYKVTIEMKSVNHRYLDLSVRLPRKLNFYEPAIRNQVKEVAKRGKSIFSFPWNNCRKTLNRFSIILKLQLLI